MNALLYAVNTVMERIPVELLQAGMNIHEQESTVNLTSLGDKILRKVIKKRVMMDANVIGGIETIIPLNNISPSFSEHFYTVYNIPSELTNNKEIISALNITFMPGSGYFGQVAGHYGGNSQFNNSSFGNYNSFNPTLNVADRIGNAASSNGVMTNAHIEIVAYNTVLIYAHYRTLANFGLRVVLENDVNMNNLQPRSYPNFAMLCTLAVKAYLYRVLSIAINAGYLSGGQDLGMFKSRLEEYASAEEDYTTFLQNVWGVVAFINDTTRMNRFIGSMISPDL